MRGKSSHGFSLIELLVVMAVIGVLIGLLLPAVQMAREAARRTRCINNLKQIMLAAANYEDAYAVTPFYQPSWQRGSDNSLFSGLSRLLPFLEQEAVYNQINFSVPGSDIPGAGPGGATDLEVPDNSTAARTRLAVFVCPTDAVENRRPGVPDLGDGSYCANYGWPSAVRGRVIGYATIGFTPPPFAPLGYFGNQSVNVKAKSIVDGLSKTAAFSERLINPGSLSIGLDRRRMFFRLKKPVGPTPTSMEGLFDLCARSDVPMDYSDRLGGSWLSGDARFGGMFTVLMTPNSMSCTDTFTQADYECFFATGDAGVTPSSDHPSGVNVAMADGSVSFVSTSIGRGVWWAMGSRDGGETQ